MASPQQQQQPGKWSTKLPQTILPSESSSFHQYSASNLAGIKEWPFAANSSIGLEEASSVFASELKHCEELDALILKGEDWIHRLYAYRCISRALPSSKDESHYKNTFELLKPRMLQLLDLIAFCNVVQQHLKDTLVFLQNVQPNKSSKKKTLPKIVLGKMVNLIDVMVTLDHVKDMKTPWVNDFSSFKRAYDQLNFKDEEMTRKIAEVHAFLSDPKAPRATILTHVKEQSLNFKYSENVLVEVFAFALEELDRQHFCFPEEKFRLLRFLSSAIFLLDGLNDFNAFRHRRINSREVKAWFHQYPVLPLFADLHISVIFVLEQCPNFKILIETKPGVRRDWIDNSEETTADEAAVRRSEEATRKRYELQTHWQDIRKEFDAFSVRFALLKSSQASDLDYFTMSLEGLLLLGKWKELILLQAAYKFSRGANHAPDSCNEYDRVGRENYKPVELHILFDVVCLIKSLSAMMIEASTERFAFAIRRRIHFELQDFAQLKLLTICQNMHASKKKQSSHALQTLNQLRTASVDWLGGPLPDIKTLAQQAKNAPAAERIDVSRAVGPSPNQLLLVRCFLEQLVEKPETNFLTSWVVHADFDRAQIDMFKQFLTRSFFFPYVLAFEQNVKRNADLSFLWHREFYLDMTKQVQFPIESSLPWIVIKHVLNSNDSTMIDSVLFFLDIYNDAADFALNVLKQGHLFDEVEGEAKLVFEQFVFLLTDHIYTDFKAASSARVLDDNFRLRLQELKFGAGAGTKKRKSRANVFFLNLSSGPAGNNKSPLERDYKRYDSILAERAFQFLGRRDIDLSRLISDGLNAYFRQDMNEILSRFESYGITSSRELEALLCIVEQMHDELKHRGLVLDDFTLMLEQLDERIASTTIRSRIIKSTCSELIADVMPNFSFNSLTERFIRSPTSANPDFTLKPKSKSIPPNFLFGSVFKDAYQKAFSLEREFVGLVHLDAMLRVAGFDCTANGLPARAAFVANAILDQMKELVLQMSPLLKERAAYMEYNPPTALATPQYFSGSQAYNAFDSQAKQIFPLNHSDRTVLFQLFKEFGNGLALIKLLGLVCDRAELEVWSETSMLLGLDYVNALPPQQAFDLNNTPLLKTEFKSREEQEEALDLAKLSLLNSYRSGTIWANATKTLAECISREFVSFHTSFFQVFNLMQFSYTSTAGGMSTSLPPKEDDNTELGDGFLWTGHFILTVLGQKEKFDLVDGCSHVARADALERCWRANLDSDQNAIKVNLFTKCVRETIDPNKVLISSLFSRSLGCSNDDDGEEKLFHPFHPQNDATTTAAAAPGAGSKRSQSARGMPPPPPPAAPTIPEFIQSAPPPPPPPPHIQFAAPIEAVDPFHATSLGPPPPPPPPPPRSSIDEETVSMPRRASRARAPPPPVPPLQQADQQPPTAPKRPPRARTTTEQ